MIAFLEEYKKDNNQYPSTEELYTLIEKNKLEISYIRYYFNQKNEKYPIVSYSSPNTIFDDYEYDFVDKKWIYRVF